MLRLPHRLHYFVATAFTLLCIISVSEARDKKKCRVACCPPIQQCCQPPQLAAQKPQWVCPKGYVLQKGPGGVVFCRPGETYCAHEKTGELVANNNTILHCYIAQQCNVCDNPVFHVAATNYNPLGCSMANCGGENAWCFVGTSDDAQATEPQLGEGMKLANVITANGLSVKQPAMTDTLKIEIDNSTGAKFVDIGNVAVNGADRHVCAQLFDLKVSRKDANGVWQLEGTTRIGVEVSESDPIFMAATKLSNVMIVSDTKNDPVLGPITEDTPYSIEVTVPIGRVRPTNQTYHIIAQ